MECKPNTAWRLVQYEIAGCPKVTVKPQRRLPDVPLIGRFTRLLP